MTTLHHLYNNGCVVYGALVFSHFLENKAELKKSGKLKELNLVLFKFMSL